MSFTEATKPDRKSGGSRGTCSAPFLNATAKVEAFKAAELLDGRICGSPLSYGSCGRVRVGF
jgi:hypothetical protein